MKKQFLILFISVITCTAVAQQQKEVLLTIDGEPVYVNDFKRIYNKNLDLVKDETQKTVDGYLDLFVDYKLKVTEAYAQNLHKEQTYTLEYEKYRNQLSRNYIYETKITEELTQEAYDRSLEEINANHILILSGYDDAPEDTLRAYNKIKMIYDKAKAGEDFETLAATYSQEPGADESKGNLGYFTAFSMVYPFETMAYNTKVGEVSEIVRTSFGYHIIKVNDRRPASQEISVSHIMISESNKPEDFNAEERINEIGQLLQQGESFEALAKQYSDDKRSGREGGLLRPFRKGSLRSATFEEAAYALNTPGELSKPIKSEFGWHIIRLNEKMKQQSFEEQQKVLYDKVSRGDRSKVVSAQVTSKIKDKFGYTSTNFMPFYLEYVNDDLMSGTWKMDTLQGAANKVLFTIGDKKIRYNDFSEFMAIKQRSRQQYRSKEAKINAIYNQFEENELKEFFKENLEKTNEDFATTISEYRDGLLIFDVMKKNVWDKAKNDSVGLQAYYKNMGNTYMWDTRVDVDLYTSSIKENVEEAKKMLEQGKTKEEIKEAMNKDENLKILITSNVYEKGDSQLPVNLKLEEGVSPLLKEGTIYIAAKVNEVLPPSKKTFEDVKGRVMSEYQNKIEAEWIESLRAKYNVDINKKALKKVKKELQK